MSRNAGWTRAVYEARYAFRCAGVPSQQVKFDAQPVIDGIADIAHMRLILALAPLLRALDDYCNTVGRIE